MEGDEMLELPMFDDVAPFPTPRLALYTVTKRRGSDPRDDDPEADTVVCLDDVFDLRSPRGDVIATDRDLGFLRVMQMQHNAVAVLG
jgi:hypothetical protein